MKVKFAALLAFSLLAIATAVGCGRGGCSNQKTCPDGSWSAVKGTGTTTTITGSFLDFMASMLHRDKSSAQITLKAEMAIGTSALPVGYRKVSRIGNDTIPTPGDDDGYNGGSVTFGSRPVTTCGTTQTTIAARIAACAAANSSMATWDGSVNGNGGQGTWKLVTYNGVHEVWRDERTTLLWSDSLGTAPSWCVATGSSGGGPYGEVDQYGLCDSVTYQPNQAFPESWCMEDPGLNTPALYDSMKGGMRLASTGSSPSVVWRVPTKWDYHLAEANGLKFPLPVVAAFFWTATVFTDVRSGAWYLNANTGQFTVGGRFRPDVLVRCVGR